MTEIGTGAEGATGIGTRIGPATMMGHGMTGDTMIEGIRTMKEINMIAEAHLGAFC